MDNSIPSTALDLINLWGVTSYKEPEEIMAQFTKEFGAGYTKYDFAKFLRNKYCKYSQFPTKLPIAMSE